MAHALDRLPLKPFGGRIDTMSFSTRLLGRHVQWGSEDGSIHCHGQFIGFPLSQSEIDDVPTSCLA